MDPTPQSGLISSESRHSVPATIDRLHAALTANGVTIFARIDHAAGAAAVGMDLRPTELLIFGDPRAGTKLMQAQQSIAIDLPLKMLAWQDESGKVWLSHPDMVRLAMQYGIDPASTPSVQAIASALEHLATAATAH
jgi:uncharacterized protein (DUF302 family)